MARRAAFGGWGLSGLLFAAAVVLFVLAAFNVDFGDFDRFDVFAGPIVDNAGNELLPAGGTLQQSDLDQFPPGAPGAECSVCMYWWNEGITSELPELQ